MQKNDKDAMDFYNEGGVTPIRGQYLPQTIETPVTFEAAPGVYLRYAYSRSSDSMSNQIDGQDYLCYKHNDQRFTAVVCDGVGSSFCGNLAARILGENLLDWLWGYDIIYQNGPAALMESAVAYLNKLQKMAQVEVAEYEIPEEITGLIRQALEGQRAYGSEAVFAACRIDHPSPSLPDGLVSILWMGDTHIEVLDNAGTMVDLGGEFANADRWSTVRGARGKAHTWMAPLPEVGRVLAYSDGLLAHGANLKGYSDTKLDQEIRAGAKLPTSDDVAFIDMVVRSPFYEGYPEGEAYDPAEKRPVLKPIWNPTGEEVFDLNWEWEGRGKTSFLIQEASNPALIDAVVIESSDSEKSWKPDKPKEPGNYYYRVRAIPRWGRISPWSELRMTKVAYPTPPAPVFAPVEDGSMPSLEWTAEGDALDYRLEVSVSEKFEETTLAYEGRNSEWAGGAGQFTPGTYFFRVRASSDGGEGPWSEPVSVEVLLPPPPVPHPGNITYDGLHGGYELRWQGSIGATHYEVRREAESGDEVIEKTEETSYLFGELEPGDYMISVRACHEYGASDWSITQSLAILPPPPTEAPEITVEDQSSIDDPIRLSWSEVEGAKRYLLEISEEPDFANAQFRSIEGLELEIARREPGLLHYRVAGENPGGEGPWSNVVTSMITPPPPDWVEVNPADEGGIAVSWSSVGARAAYRVVRIRPGGDEETVFEGDGYQFHDALAPADIDLTYKVRVELPGIHSEWAESAAVNFEGPKIGIPTIEKPVAREGGILSLAWSEVEGAEKYLLEVARSRDFKTSNRQIESPYSRGRFTPHAAGSYFFRVYAVMGGANQVMSKPSNVVTHDVKRPAGPVIWPLDPVKAGQPFMVSWKGIPNCLTYRLEAARSEDFTGEVKDWSVAHPKQEFAHPGAEAGRLYLRVRAEYKREYTGEQTSEWSKVVPVDIE